MRIFSDRLPPPPLTSAFLANVVEKEDFLIVTAEIEYTFTDMFTNPLDLPEGKSEHKDWDGIASQRILLPIPHLQAISPLEQSQWQQS
jgi:hypothetical protein